MACLVHDGHGGTLAQYDIAAILWRRIGVAAAGHVLFAWREPASLSLLWLRAPIEASDEVHHQLAAAELPRSLCA